MTWKVDASAKCTMGRNAMSCSAGCSFPGRRFLRYSFKREKISLRLNMWILPSLEWKMRDLGSVQGPAAVTVPFISNGSVVRQQMTPQRDTSPTGMEEMCGKGHQTPIFSDDQYAGGKSALCTFQSPRPKIFASEEC
jgi:hypothetical protein